MRVITAVATLLQIGVAGSLADTPATQESVRHDSARTLTVAEAIESVRSFSTFQDVTIATSGEVRMQRQDVFVSPDGMHYVLVLVRGDLRRNGNWLEFVVGSLRSFEEAQRFRKVASLFLSSKGARRDDGSAYVTHASWNRIQWLPDSKHVAFLYSPDQSPVQVYALNIETGDLEPLTKAERGVLNYELSTQGMLVYTSLAIYPNDKSAELLQNGFSVAESSTLIDILRGDVDGYTYLDWTANVERFVVTLAKMPERKIVVNSEGRDRFWSTFDTAFSADGRFALVDGTPDSIPSEWKAYTQPTLRTLLDAHQKDGMQGLARQMKVLYVVDLDNLSVRLLWNAPKGFAYAAWSPDSRSILVGPTFLPLTDSKKNGLGGSALAIVDANTLSYNVVPVPDHVVAQGFANLRWRSNDHIEVTSGSGLTIGFTKYAGLWRLAEERQSELDAGDRRTGIRMELRQDLNSPPALHAVDIASGRAELVLDLNPKLRNEVRLGRVEHFTWSDADRRAWSGLLYFPVGYSKSKRYPLVIQTHGHAPVDEFSLYGHGENLGPSGAPYAAQALAGRGMAVLQIEDKYVPGIESTSREPQMYMATYEAAVEALAAAGIIDPSKVGLSGFSATGFHVQYAITYSNFPYAAALASDNVDGSYLQHLAWGRTAGIGEQVNGAPPFGVGLESWMRNAVGFNVDRIRTPLRLEVQNGGLTGVLQGWEVFSRLRELGKPVEYYFIPDIEHGVHGVQNPRQCLGSQEGAVDWFDFWLNGREDATADKAVQYARWRKLRALGQGSSEVRQTSAISPAFEAGFRAETVSQSRHH